VASSAVNRSILAVPGLPGVLLVATAVLMVIDLYLIFLVAPTDAVLGHVQRIFYFHVPIAIVSFVAFFVVFVASIGYYLAAIGPLSNWVGREDFGFLHGWTTFFWAWWLSWSPFVGMFIARVSRGRTVRESSAAC